MLLLLAICILLGIVGLLWGLYQRAAASRRIADLTQERESLARERQILRTLIDNIPDFVYAKDTESRFIVANRTLAHTIGTNPEQLIGKTDFDFFEPSSPRLL